MATKPRPDRVTGAVDLVGLCRCFSERSPQPMIAVEGASHVVIFVNHAFEQFVGKDRRELMGRPFDQAVLEGKCTECLALLDRVYRTGQPESLLEHEHIQTPPAFWSYSMWPILGNDQRPAGVMIQVTDATEMATFRRDVTAVNEALTVSAVRQHELAETLERRVEERTAELKTANEELKRSNHDLEQFAYVSSHDLQEPLRMVANYLGLLEMRYKDKLDEDANTFIGYALEGAQRMQRLILDLLDYSRVTSRGRPLEPTDCQKLLEDVLENLQLHIQETGATITHDPLPTVMADPSQLVRVFQNLIGNALKFRQPDGLPQIHFGAERRDGEWLFSVRDNGIGIEPRHYERIFTLFQRLHTRKQYEGTGIGLAVVKRIVERHGGRVWVESTPGEGSTFYFTMPATPCTLE